MKASDPAELSASVARDKTYEDLEWDRIAQGVAERCVGPRAAHPQLPVAASPQGARQALAETEEAWALRAAGEPLPLDGLRDVRWHLERLERQGALDAPALRDIQSTLAAARVLRRFLGKRKARASHLLQACSTDPTLDELADEIGASIASDGTLCDDASLELRRLRTEVANLRGRLVSRLEALIEQRADILQDRYYTIREGRYVLPVRTDAHERFPGIVHGTSASGATVFVEPRQLVTQGNRLKMAHSEMEREETRILSILSQSVRERLERVRAAADALDQADLRNACARLGEDMAGTMVRLVDERRVMLREARHPLLVLERGSVVPNDIAIEAGRALVISGPNAGGKTVALKVMGLAALMVRAGLPVPCAEGSECGFFREILTDVGDHQSIEANLSTFSAHVTNLARILERADEGTLVLLDELAGSTDPQEGAALASAIVDVLCSRGSAVAATTHYEPLKAMAARDERLRNASVGFDVDRMEPTFELALDIAGSSSALAVAARFGIAKEVIDRARELLPEQARTFEALVQELGAKQAELEAVHAEAERDRERARQQQQEADQRLQKAKAREQQRLGEEADKLLGSLRRARQEVDQARKRVKRERRDEAAVREAQRTADQAARALDAAQVGAETDAAPQPPPAGEGPLEVGARVWVPRLRTAAEVVEGPSRGKLRVAAGPMKLWVDADSVRTVSPGADDGSHNQRALAASDETSTAGTVQRAVKPPVDDNTLDLRGLRVDDAVAMLDSFLDRLYGRDEPVGYVIHGIGSGALRDAVRRHLQQERRYVRQVRAGSREEGGERVTVVLLR